MFMRHALTALLLTLLFATPVAHAQEGDMEYFDAFDGLQRIIARNWMAPLTVIESEEIQMLNEDGTPIASWRTDPIATPEPQSGIGQFTVFVYFFDSDEHASLGFERIDAETQETMRRDPRAPMTDDLPLGDIGDRAVGYMGNLTEDDVDVTYAFATVQDGPFVYQLFSISAGIDADSVMQDTAETLVRQPMNRMAEHYDPEGGSQGGLWSKFDSVDPDMPDGSTINDLIIYPLPEATPGASPVPESPRLDLDDPDSIAGLNTIDHLTYTADGDSTPSPGQTGVFRIDTWLLTFDSEVEVRDAAVALDNTLIEPFGIFRGRGGAVGFGEDLPPYSSLYEGYIEDRALPAGLGAVAVRQQGPTLAGVAIYAIEDESGPIAEALADTLLASGFPESGDSVLHDLVPSAEPDATPVS